MAEWKRVLTKWRSRKSQRGAAALEFALVAPVLIMLVFGIVEFGTVMTTQAVVANAAREGSRSAALGGNTFQAQAATEAAIAAMPGATDSGTIVVVTCKTASGSACSLDDATVDTGGTVTVTLTYVHTWLAPVVLGFDPTITLQGQSLMRIE